MALKSEISNSEVLIVGAGPAGSFAAEILARNGVKVTLFDGRAPETPKPCGGGVTSKALKMYPQLLEAVGRQIDDLEIYAPSGKRLRLKLDEPFAIYSRSAFDSFLRERAEKAGANVVKEKVALVGEENGFWKLRSHATSGNANEYRGAFLVAADGANSAIAKRLSGALEKSEMEVAFGYRAPLPENEGDTPTVVAFLPGFAGYAWAFPRTDHVSFGIATAQDGFDHKNLDKVLWQFMIGYYRQRKMPKEKIWQDLDDAKNAELKDLIFETAEPYAARIPRMDPKTWDFRKTCGNNWALLGDAAGFADPITDEGIYYALRSAELFSDAFLKNAPHLYETFWRADFGQNLKRASQMRNRFYGKLLKQPFTERMVQFGHYHFGTRQILANLISGNQEYLNLKRELICQLLHISD